MVGIGIKHWKYILRSVALSEWAFLLKLFCDATQSHWGWMIKWCTFWVGWLDLLNETPATPQKECCNQTRSKEINEANWSNEHVPHTTCVQFFKCFADGWPFFRCDLVKITSQEAILDKIVTGLWVWWEVDLSCQRTTQVSKWGFGSLHPRKLTWIPKMMVWKR